MALSPLSELVERLRKALRDSDRRWRKPPGILGQLTGF
jgi:hypothetical protein